ncbi:MAG: hypothetical protein QMA97_01060, partial [Glaciecola sp.]
RCGECRKCRIYFSAYECIKLCLIIARTSPYDLHGCRKCRNERDVFLPTYMDVGSAEIKGMNFYRPTGMWEVP